MTTIFKIPAYRKQDILEQIEHNNEKIMNFLHDHVEPERVCDNIEDEGLRTICNAIKKWHAEMGEYWCDDNDRISHNYTWGACIRAAINKFNKNCYTVDEEERAIINGEF